MVEFREGEASQTVEHNEKGFTTRTNSLISPTIRQGGLPDSKSATNGELTQWTKS